MLRFATKPDTVFTKLLREACPEAIGHTELEDDPAEQRDALENLLPRTSKLFDVPGLKAQLIALNAASAASELYQPTDYHWLLLYEVLDAYCLEFNEAPRGPLFTEFGIERIDFDHLVDVFFWDTDFLDPHIPSMSLESRELLDISSETFGLTAGLKPHPEELVIEMCKEEIVREFEDDPCELYMKGSKEYPTPLPAESS